MKATKRLFNLWLRFNKRCKWCGRETILPKDGTDSRLWATRDHLYHRKDNRRYKALDGSGIVLACGECNVERGHKTYWKEFKGKNIVRYNQELKELPN